MCATQISFWNCMNETLEEIDKGKGWIGRPCCQMPQSEKCMKACLQAQSSLDLESSCRKSDEIAFYTCIERQDAGERCCKNAQTSSCREACKSVFDGSIIPSKAVREAVHKHCFDSNPRVQQCIHPHIHLTPADHQYRMAYCCDRAHYTQCRTSCKETMRTETTNEEILDGISKACGPPLPHVPLWQCFLNQALTNEPGGTLIQSERVGMDSAKLQCCFRAATIYCQRLCIETFTFQWTSSWNDFDRLCQYQLAESKMARCLNEVDEPCELGCEGLGYCTNFNFRPTELFRSCDLRSDRAAQQDVESWENGVIHLPMIEIPVLKISECHSEVWKAIACALQIKPCHTEAHVNRICKADCIDILTKCVDRSRLKHNQNPITLCEILSPPGNDTPCISLAPYLIQSEHVLTALEITHPCKPNKCDQHDVCMVDRNCLSNQKCSPYTCIPGCRMGDVSQLIVPRNSFVRVPSKTRGPQCHMVCYCNQDNEIEDCMTPSCIMTDPCWHEGKRYDHNTMFLVGCKTCFCYDGEITCSPKHCGSGLPCNCQDHYVPVCGANGKTYPSACLAR
ncbi:reversion-inducing cysteine-rich protein with Kazal motifs [Trichonephila clavipes]|nr:reversion-inducing cysteine-rich protein with Kazal motifs [Trichonephila clavipes]